jgi:hypothetical protein
MRLAVMAAAAALLLVPATAQAHFAWLTQAVAEAGFSVSTPAPLKPLPLRPGDRPGTRLYGASEGPVAYLVSIGDLPSPQASDDATADQLVAMTSRGRTLLGKPRRVGSGEREYLAVRDGLTSRIRIKVAGDRVIIASVADGPAARGPDARRFLGSLRFLPRG